MNLSVLEPQIKFTAASPIPISSVVSAIKDFDEGRPSTFKLNLRPSYQRGEAWDQDFKEMLIYSLITNYPIGNFLFRRLSAESTNEPTHEVVDGQQRLLTIKQFIDGQWKLSSAVSKHVIEENINSFKFDYENNINPPAIKVYSRYVTDPTSYIRLGFTDLPSTISSRILGHPLNIVEVIQCTDEAITQFFRFIQNQERLRAGEIINAIPDSVLSKYMDKIHNKSEFLNKINWNESRKEFDKIFYSMAGIFDNKLNFGTTDSSIIEYVANFNGFENDGEQMFLRMIDCINKVSACGIKNENRFSKRLIKFFFLTAGFGILDYFNNPEVNFRLLLDVEKKLPSFNSGKQEEINKTFNGTDPAIIDLYNQLFILGRGSHSSSSTKKIISNFSIIARYELQRGNQNQ